jgi:hypothetical protein
MRAAMRKLVPAALILASHPVPGCADPGRLYSRLVARIYRVGASARSAGSPTDLRAAAAPLHGLARIEHGLASELRRTLSEHVRQL